MGEPMRLLEKDSIGSRRRAVNRLEPMGKEPQAPSAWAIAVGPGNLTIREKRVTKEVLCRADPDLWEARRETARRADPAEGQPLRGMTTDAECHFRMSLSRRWRQPQEVGRAVPVRGDQVVGAENLVGRQNRRRRAGERRLAERGERVQAAKSVSYRWKEESGFGLHSPARTPPVIGATTRRVMDGNEATLRACSCSDDLPVLRAISLGRHAVATTPAGSCEMLSFHSPTTAAFPEILPGRLPHLGLSRPAQRSLTLRPAYSLSRQMRPVASKAPTISLPPSPLRLLPAGTTVAGRDLHPLKMHALARRTVI